MTEPSVVYGIVLLFLPSVGSLASSVLLQAIASGSSKTNFNKEALIKLLQRICLAQTNKQTS